jgi:hypothetical protein
MLFWFQNDNTSHWNTRKNFKYTHTFIINDFKFFSTLQIICYSSGEHLRINFCYNIKKIYYIL